MFTVVVVGKVVLVLDEEDHERSDKECGQDLSSHPREAKSDFLKSRT
jgi:hypothetical protein